LKQRGADFSDVQSNALQHFAKRNFVVKSKYDFNSLIGSISIIGPGTQLALGYSHGVWYTKGFVGRSVELPGKTYDGLDLPNILQNQASQSALDSSIDMAIDFVPIVGSGRDIYRGIENEDYLLLAIGVGGLVLDIVTLGGSSLIKGTVKTIAKKGIKNATKTEIKNISETRIKNISKEVVKNLSTSSLKDGAKWISKTNSMMNKVAKEIQKEAIKNPDILLRHGKWANGISKELDQLADGSFATYGRLMEIEMNIRLQKLFPGVFQHIGQSGKKSVDWVDYLGFRWDVTSDRLSVYWEKIVKYQDDIRGGIPLKDTNLSVDRIDDVTVNVVQYSQKLRDEFLNIMEKYTFR
jgi:hypothetical protein